MLTHKQSFVFISVISEPFLTIFTTPPVNHSFFHFRLILFLEGLMLLDFFELTMLVK